MSIIYFVRHAERDVSIKTDETAPLTAKGHEDADKIKNFFTDKNIQAIYSSPYQRTIHTIEPTAFFLDLPINLIDNFHERKIGSWIDDFNVYAEQQWKDFDYKRQDGESLNDVYNRLISSYNRIEKELAGNTIICGHGTAFAILFHHLTDKQFGYQQWSSMKMPDIYSYDVETKELRNVQYSNQDDYNDK
ncbi:histidine phosphatase family protein [Macrococcus lamae]|uniref:Histidine phosphatase family protein n=1 Tax=Macrococcus lamae TaxID=198484 RepID=A0A4R6BS90_9STAP|nr:histidine phosphatase family protein [Macrococcus lamae]TDM05223.1 histidine phosphatase family protein [Macrococcus lamae]